MLTPVCISDAGLGKQADCRLIHISNVVTHNTAHLRFFMRGRRPLKTLVVQVLARFRFRATVNTLIGTPLHYVYKILT